MSGQDIAIFRAIGAKLDYLSQRHKVIAENIANADTPKYRPQDLRPVDFGAMVRGIAGDSAEIAPAITSKAHIGAQATPPSIREGSQKTVYEVAPAGNAVIIEEQLLSAGRNVMDYNLMLNLYQKQIGMMKTALGVR